MSYLSEFRSLNPQFERVSDDVLIEYLPKLDAETFGGLDAEQVKYKATNDSWQITKGFKAGIDQTQALGYGMAALTGDALGSDDIKEWGIEGYQRNMTEASLNAGQVQGFTDIESADDALSWAAYTAGNLVPTMATTVAGGGIGGALAKQGVKAAAANMMKQELAKGVSREVAAKTVGQLIGKRIATGQGLGAFATSAGMEMGSIYGETGDAGVSAAHGAVAGALDALPVMRVLGKFGIAKAAKDDVTRSVVGEISKQGAFEGGTEALQTLIEQHAAHWVETNGESLLNNLGAANWKEIADATAAGALGGGIMGGGSALLTKGETQSERGDYQQNLGGNLAGDVQTPPPSDPMQASVQAGLADIETFKGDLKASDLGVQFEQPQQDWSQYDMPAAQRFQPEQDGQTEIDLLIGIARKQGFAEDEVRLQNAKRLFAMAEDAWAKGDKMAGARFAERGNAIVQDITEPVLRERVSQMPVPYQFQGEVTGGELQPSSGEPSIGATYDAEAQPARVRGLNTKGLERKPADNLLTDQGIIYGNEPDDVRAAREQREADDFNARYGQAGPTPYRPTALEGEVLNPGQVTDENRMLPNQTGRTALLTDNTVGRLPPGTGQMDMGRDRPDRQFNPASAEYEGVGRNIVERQAPTGLALPNNQTPTQAQVIDFQRPTSMEIDAAAAETHEAPSDAQIEAGNYKKGRVKIAGLQIAIENRKGSTRTGVDASGKRWESEMAHHYGDIKGYKGADGDDIDVFIGDNPESTKVFIVDQVDPKTGRFDEHKAMVGFTSIGAAKNGYLANYEKNWSGLGEISELTEEQFKSWLKGDTTKPYALKADNNETPFSYTASGTLKIKGDTKALRDKLQNAGIKHTPTANGVNVSAKYADQARAAVPVSVEHIDGATLETFEDGRIALDDGVGTVEFGTDREAMLNTYRARRDEREARDAKQRQQAQQNANKTYNREPDPLTDDLLNAIALGGGINRDYAEGVDPADFSRRAAGIRLVFPKATGRSMDEMTEYLRQYGYVNTVEDLQDKLDRSLRGEKVMTPEGAAQQAAREAEEAARMEQPIESVTGETDKHETWLAIATNEAIASGVPMGEITRILNTHTDDTVMSVLELRNAIEHIENDTNQASIQSGKSAEGSRSAQESGFGFGTQIDPESFFGSEDPLLTSYTEAELSARDRELAQAATQAEKERQAAEQKAQADAELNDFSLTGSDRPADVAAAAGQSDMFGASPRSDQAPRTPSPETDTAPSDAQGAQARPALTADNDKKIDAFLSQNNAHMGRSETIDWGGLPRGQGKRVKGMTTGAMSDAVALQGKKHYMDLIGKLKDSEPENYRDAIETLGVTDSDKPYLVMYSKLRAAGYQHDESMTYVVRRQVRASEASQSAQPITDFGEKLGGARKDVWSGFRESLSDEIDTTTAPLSKSFPDPDYVKLADAGADREVLALIALMRNSIPPKPRKKYRVSHWADRVNTVKGFARDLIDGAVDLNTVKRQLERAGGELAGLGYTSPVLAKIDPAILKEAAKYRIEAAGFSMFRGESRDSNVPMYFIKKEGRSNFDTASESLGETQATLQKLLDKHEAQPAKQAGKQSAIHVYTNRVTDEAFIGWKGATGVLRIKSGFDSSKEARAYLDNHRAELEDRLAQLKQTPSERRTVNARRDGPERREGNVTPELFAETFGFRGVEFGNWVEGSKRQSDLNESYDSLIDFAEILGVPPRALSLNGELGLAFGARGKGGKDAAAAHYESDKVVINLTKKAGPGSLAHEWWHAMDNYFSRMRKDRLGFMSDRPYELQDKSVRPEMVAAFKGVMQAIKQSGLPGRAQALDRTKSKAYWSTDVELSARAFESFIITKLKEQGISNDYLANIVSQEYWDANEALGLEDTSTYPYLKADELGAVNEAYQVLFDVLETKVTDSGVALFSRSAADTLGTARANKVRRATLSVEAVERAAAGIAKRLRLRGVKLSVHASEAALPERLQSQIAADGAEGEIKAALHEGTIHIVADRMTSVTDVEEAVFHEGAHFGGRALFGREMGTAYRKLWMQIGGKSGMREKAKAAGFNMDQYFKTADELLAAGEIDAGYRARYLVDEFLAHLNQQRAHETLPGRIKRAVQEFIGAIRNALRKAGFAKLPDLSDSDLSYLLKKVNSAAKGEATSNDKPHFMRVSEDERINFALEDLAAQFGEPVFSRVPDDAPVIETDGDGIGDAADIREMKEKAREYAKKHFAGSTVTNTRTQDKIIIPMAGVRHTLQGAQADLLKSIAVTPQILEQGRYLGSHPEKKENPAIIAHHYYGIKVEIDGRRHDVIADVREMADGKRYYDHSFERKKMEPESTAPSNSRNSSSTEDYDSSSTGSIEEKPMFSRASAAESFDDLDANQEAFLNKIGPQGPVETLKQRVSEVMDNWRLKVRQQVVDRFAPLYEIDKQARGEDVIESSIRDSSWVLARMANAADGALSAMLNFGRIHYSEGVIDLQEGSTGLIDTLKQLGDSAEIERFMGWVAANRAEKLMTEGRENLFTEDEIAAGIQLNRGRTEDGADRAALYDRVFTEFQQHRDDVLKIAAEAGIISEDQYTMWRDEFYVPFYRVMEDEDVKGPRAGSGLSRQEAYKKLKGGSQNLNDLLGNTLMNFNHLITASMKNMAAQKALQNAEKVGVAEATTENARDKKASTFVLKGGVKVWYNVNDPLVYRSLISMTDSVIKFPGMGLMRAFKRVFTNFTTASPQFIAANFIRDTLQAAATSEVSGNVLKNATQGIKAYGVFDKQSRSRAKMMASGGAFSFGHVYGSDADTLKIRIDGELRKAHVLKDPAKAFGLLRAAWDKYHDMSDSLENANRAAVFEQNQDRGKLYAAFKARDLMDFSQRGVNPAVMFLIDTVPFLNARIQGLDKLYRSGVKPIGKVVAGKASAADKQAALRFSMVTGALTLATIALYLQNRDDEDYQALEEWQKDTYWFFKVGNDAFFIPKPFEVGAIATLAERSLEQVVDDQADADLFLSRIGHMLSDTFSFNPLPQMFRPVLDVKANEDSFTGRAIESMGMERLSPSLRYRNSTSDPAKWLSTGLENTVGAAFGKDSMLVASPVQIDYMVRNYLGWLGERAVAMVDTASKALNGVDEPEKAWSEYQPMRRFYRDLDKPGYTKYQTAFYEDLREVNRIHADVRKLQELGQQEEALALYRENGDKLRYRTLMNGVQRKLTATNARMKMIERSELPGEVKRKRLDVLQAQKNKLTKMVSDRIN